MYVAVKSGENAVKHARRLVAKARRGDHALAQIQVEQIMNQMALAVDRVMAEGSLYDPLAAATAIRQAQGDLVEAVFLVRALRTTLPRFGNSKPAATDKMRLFRRISGIFKDIPGGQILGPTYDYTHRLIEFEGQEDQTEPLPPIPDTRPLDTCPIDEKFIPWVRNLLVKQDLIPEIQKELIGASVPDLTRQPLKLPAGREVRLQNMARGDEGFLLASAYSLQRGFGLDRHPFLGELRVGWATLVYTPPELGFEIEIGEVKLTECFMVNRTNGGKERRAGLESGYGITFGQNERKAMSAALLDRSLTKACEEDAQVKYPAQDQEFILAHSDNVESSGFVQHLKLPHYVDFQSELVFIRNQNKERKSKGKEKVNCRV
ncbi:carbon-phosphorus lyase complex subunit PhnI [Desulfobacter curvatus]|uniref:carbon-phosphorus lyase complex subunit PhnI n=1 Tax=Desulfobacter curvatus TaxID=2290 RepID=UPI0003669CF8|nr:carbon-phosphorus lyase complex subunit PhnI [Desulfobacter curvatus]